MTIVGGAGNPSDEVAKEGEEGGPIGSGVELWQTPNRRLVTLIVFPLMLCQLAGEDLLGLLVRRTAYPRVITIIITCPGLE